MRMKKVAGAVLLYVLWTVAHVQAAGVTFTDLSQSAGFNATSCSLSAAWGDADNDGDMDVMVASHIQPKSGGRNHFYRNNGNLTFTDVIDQNGLLSYTEDPHGVGWGDFDNDGDADLAVAHGLLLGKSPQNNELYENAGNGVFGDIAAGAGVTAPATQQVTGVSWIDENNDGFLDLFLAGKSGDMTALGNFLYRSNGDGTFSDAAAIAGLGAYDGQTASAAWQDYDDDGDLDVFLCFNKDASVVVKTGKSVLYQNNGDGTYSDATAASGLVTHNTCKTAAWGDYNDDGVPDLFISSLGGNANALYRNLGDGTFSDVGVMANVAEKVESHGATWGDYDNDGHLDLLVITGDNVTQHNRLYRNNGDGTFSDVSIAAGAAGLGLGKGTDGMMVDADNDGALDLFVTNGEGSATTCSVGPYLFLHNNHEENHHWLKIQLVGQIGNRDGIGAKVRLATPDGRVQYRQHFGQHFFAQDRLPLHFGLGAQTQADTLEVHWPSGVVDIIGNVAADQVLVVMEGVTDTDDDNDGVLDTDEIAAGSDPLNAASTPEVCDGLDNDLDGAVDEGFPDTDGDGVSDCVDTDNLTVIRATWSASRLSLSVQATSSYGGSSTLTVTGFGNLIYNATTAIHQRGFAGVVSNPGSITITSTGGGTIVSNVTSVP